MLAAEGRQTPRPRPPAQIRRSTSKGLSNASPEGVPPPPYALEFPPLQEANDGDMSDPVSATAKMLGIQLDTGPDRPPVTEEDVRQKSREELTNLFLHAETIIKAREKELDFAAQLGQRLLDTNIALKRRHDALLSRLPAMQCSSSTHPSPTNKSAHPDAWITDDDMPSPSPSRIHSRTNSIISTLLESPSRSRASSLVSVSPSGHGRRIAASPSALLALSETNAELIAELTRLRGSTDSAQVDGARRLRKLEREIGGLKVELDASQRVNAELEERVRQQKDEERRREREERLKKLRAGDETHAENSEIRDFAPHGHGVDTWDSVPVTPRMIRQNYVSSDRSDSEPEDDCDASASSATASVSHHNTISAGEYAVVAQLYRKIEELQEANAELGARNRVTSGQLARAEREALEIKRVYDEIGEEMGAEADAEQSEDGTPGTIKGTWPSSFMSPPRSLRSPRSSRNTTPRASSWSLRGHTLDALEDPFGNDIPARSKHGTGSRRALGNKHMYKAMRTLKSRKPLTDVLFAPPSPTPQDPGGATPSIVLFPSSGRAAKLKGKAESAPLPSRPSMYRDSSGSSLVMPSFPTSLLPGIGLTPSASASSFLSASSFTSLTRYVGRGARRSLGSELGDEFGADWSVGGTDLERHNNLFADESFRIDGEAYDDGDNGEEYAEELQEDPALAALRIALTPPYAGRLLDLDEHILPVCALTSSPGEAFQLVAHAVAARPNRWLPSDDKRIRGLGPRAALTEFAAREAGAEDPWETTRYPDIEPSADVDEVHALRMRRRGRALERMASTSTRRVSLSVGDAFELVPSASHLQTADYYPGRSRNLVQKLKRTSTDALVELWIFLQFVAVICMFVYSMSRRGPREVVGARPRRA